VTITHKKKRNIMTSQQKTFPQRYWDPNFHARLVVQDTMERLPWKTDIVIDPFPDDTSAEFRKELADLVKMQENKPQMERRIPEILAQDRGIVDSFQRVWLFEARSHPKTFEMARVMMDIASHVLGYYKHYFNRARPSQYVPQLVTVIPVPGHPAYPSGHSTQAHLVAFGLAEIIPDQGVRAELEQLAWRIAENREWAGVH
jgi:hypothetical protein